MPMSHDSMVGETYHTIPHHTIPTYHAGIYEKNLAGSKVDYIVGRASFVDKHTIEAAGKLLYLIVLWLYCTYGIVCIA